MTSSERNQRGPGEVWEEEEVFHEGDTFFGSILRGLERARSTIEFETYIFEDDATGRRVATALAAAARRGVAVRVLIDDIGSPGWMEAFRPLVESAGGEARVFHPRPFSILALTPGPSSGGRRWLRGLYNLVNRRNHRKVCIVDGQEAWLGSLNVSDRSLRSVRGDEAWHECGVRVRGAETEALREAFCFAWDRVLDPFTRVTDRPGHARRMEVFRSSSLVRLNSPLSIRRRSYRDLLRRIRAARRRIWIENPYFVPTRTLANALRQASRRGVDVRLILPRHSDIFFMPWVIPACAERLIGFGARVFEYLPSVLHAKILVVDDWVVVGSSNLNFRSLMHDLEVDAVLTTEAARNSILERLESDLTQSEEVTAAMMKRRPWHQKILGRIFLRLRYWM